MRRLRAQRRHICLSLGFRSHGITTTFTVLVHAPHSIVFAVSARTVLVSLCPCLVARPSVFKSWSSVLLMYRSHPLVSDSEYLYSSLYF